MDCYVRSIQRCLNSACYVFAFYGSRADVNCLSSSVKPQQMRVVR